MTLPAALYGYETLFLTNVKVFQNRVLTAVFGPKSEEVIVVKTEPVMRRYMI
jgi:hypothetical protein